MRVTQRKRGPSLRARLGITFAAVLGAMLLFSAPAAAATLTWTAAVNNDWSNPGNWSPAQAPATGDDLVLTPATSQVINNDLAPSVQLRSVTLSNSSNAFNITAGGNPIALQSGGSLTDNSTLSRSNNVGAGVALNGPATIAATGSSDFSLDGTITGTGGLTLTNSSGVNGRLAVTAPSASTYSGSTTFSGNALIHTIPNTVPSSSAVTVDSGASVQLGADTTYGSLAGGGTITSGPGNPFLPPSVTNLTVGGDDSSTSFSGVLQEAGVNSRLALTKAGAGTLTLSGSSTYTAGTTIGGGTLRAGAANSFSPSSAHSVSSGTMIDLNGFDQTLGSLAGAGTVTTNGNNTLTVGGDNTSTTFGGVFQATGGGGHLVKNGNGTLALSGSNDYTGDTTLNAGTLRVSANNNLGLPSTELIFNGGTLQYGAGFSSGHLVTLNAGGGTVDTNGNDATMSGPSSGTGALTKQGTGTLTLSGANSYTGATTVNAGTLSLTGTLASAATVNSGGTLVGTGTSSGDVTVNTGATLSPGTSIGTLTANGDVGFVSGADFQVELASGGVADRLRATGNANLGGADLDLSLLGGYTHTPGTAFEIVDSDNPISGTFAGPSTIDVDGHRFRLDYAIDPTKVFLVATKATPGLTANASGPVEIGGQVSDTANMTNGLDPSGQITFRLYGPGDPGCSGAPVFTDTKAVSGNGNFASADFTPTEPGTYRWTASYSGDGDNDAAATNCNDASQAVTVSSQPDPPDPPLDPTLEITGVELDRDEGTATLTLAANVPGQVHIAKSNKVKSNGPATVEDGTAELEVTPRNKAAKKLERKGRLTVNPKVILNPAAGGELLARREITLRQD